MGMSAPGHNLIQDAQLWLGLNDDPLLDEDIVPLSSMISDDRKMRSC